MVWTAESGSPSKSASRPVRTLVEAFEKLGLRLDSRFAQVVKRRIALAAETEWRQRAFPGFEDISTERTKHLLGGGFVLTEFLIAPTFVSSAKHANICALGALVNLMVVICDSRLDSGEAIEDVLPRTELQHGGGESSPVMVLLREYFNILQDVGPDPRMIETAKRVVAQMFEAEIGSVRTKGTLPFYLWMRKSALPFVLMALPAWARFSYTPTPGYLRWLHKVGRIFGAIDDAVDADEDLVTGHPNYWNSKPAGITYDAAIRVADWGRHVLTFWDSLVPETNESSVVRATFLYNVWSWLEPL